MINACKFSLSFPMFKRFWEYFPCVSLTLPDFFLMNYNIQGFPGFCRFWRHWSNDQKQTFASALKKSCSEKIGKSQRKHYVELLLQQSCRCFFCDFVTTGVNHGFIPNDALTFFLKVLINPFQVIVLMKQVMITTSTIR